MKPKGGPVTELPKAFDVNVDSSYVCKRGAYFPLTDCERAGLEQSAGDPVNHPGHYTDTGVHCPNCGHNIEVIDMIEDRGYRIGNALKYLFRYKLKGKPKQDLQKAIWYIQREVENCESI